MFIRVGPPTPAIYRNKPNFTHGYTSSKVECTGHLVVVGGAPHRVAFPRHGCTFGFGTSSFLTSYASHLHLSDTEEMPMWIIWWSQKLETNQELQATYLVAPSACDFNANEKEPELHPNFQARAAPWACEFHANGKVAGPFQVVEGAATEWKGALNTQRILSPNGNWNWTWY
jgi:hypothetical protein